MVTPFEKGSTTGFLHVPAEPLNRGLVLTHGAGGNCRAPLLLAVASAFTDAGFHVLRCDLAFRQMRHSGPPLPALAGEDRKGLAAAGRCLREYVSGAMLLGGHSYGGRQASMLAAEDPGVCDALLLLSYPLHPPDKPTQLRTAHFGQLNTPALFVHGTKDPFGTLDEVQGALRLIAARTELAVVEKAGHDLLRGRFDIAHLVVAPATQLLAGDGGHCTD